MDAMLCKIYEHKKCITEKMIEMKKLQFRLNSLYQNQLSSLSLSQQSEYLANQVIIDQFIQDTMNSIKNMNANHMNKMDINNNNYNLLVPKVEDISTNKQIIKIELPTLGIPNCNYNVMPTMMPYPSLPSAKQNNNENINNSQEYYQWI